MNTRHHKRPQQKLNISLEPEWFLKVQITVLPTLESIRLTLGRECVHIKSQTGPASRLLVLADTAKYLSVLKETMFGQCFQP